MAQHYFDFGVNVPARQLLNGDKINGLTVLKYSASTDFQLVHSGALFDFRSNKKCLCLNPVDSAGTGSESAGKTRTLMLTDINVADAEILIKHRSLRSATWGETSLFSGGCGVVFRAKNTEPPAGSSVNFSNGGVVFSGGSVGNEDTGVPRTMRLYALDYFNSNAATTGSTYLPEDSLNNRSRYFIYTRVKIAGNNIKARSWVENMTEPATWGINVDRADMPSTGYIGICVDSWIEGRVIDFMAIGTDGDLPPNSPTLYNIAGTLLNPDSTPAVNKKVRIYDKQTGALIGETMTDSLGEYGFAYPIPPTNLLQIVGVDQDDNEWKPPIHESYPVL